MASSRGGAAGGFDGGDGVIVLVAAAVALVFVAAEVRIAGAIGLPLDDGWIHLRFAENLAAGRGFGINPGEPVAGSTAPLWTLCLAGAMALGVPGLLAAKTLGFLGYAASGLVTRRLASALGLGRGLALAAGIGLVGLGRMGWGALSGMEVPLATLIVASASLWVARGRPLGAAALLGLATLARPEAGLLIPLHAVAARRLRGMAARALIAGLVLIPAVAFNLATVGRVVPAPAAAKVEGGLVGRLEGRTDAWSAEGARVVAYTREWVARLAEDSPALPALAAIGFVLLRRSAIRWVAWALVLHPAAVALLAPYRGPAFQMGRYSSHLLPLAVVLAAAGLGALLALLPPRPAWRRAAFAALALLLAWGVWPASQGYAWGVQNIDAMQVRLGRWVARRTPPTARLAVNDIGALSYVGDRRIIDLMGLATPAILPYRREGSGGILRYLERTCPDYLVIFPEWFPALVARTDLFRPVERVRLAHNLVAGAAEMVVYETAWNRWQPAARPCPGEGGGAEVREGTKDISGGTR